MQSWTCPTRNTQRNRNGRKRNLSSAIRRSWVVRGCAQDTATITWRICSQYGGNGFARKRISVVIGLKLPASKSKAKRPNAQAYWQRRASEGVQIGTY